MSTALKTQRMQAHHNDWPRVQKTGKTRKLKIKYLYLKHNKMKIKMMVSWKKVAAALQLVLMFFFYFAAAKTLKHICRKAQP